MRIQITDAEGYETIFDLMAQPYQPPWAIVIIGAALSVLTLRDWLRPRPAWFKSLTLLIPTGVLVLVGLHWFEYWSLKRAVEDGNARTVEGVVEDYITDPPTRNYPETFVVAGERFALSASTISAAYHRTSSSGGPNLEGRCARISYVLDREFTPPRKRIVLLALRQSGCAQAEPPGAPGAAP